MRARVTAWASLAAVVAIVAASAWVRWPGFIQGGFASHDVAGILYNAMVLHDGELPYVATVEPKAPGAFYVAYVFAGPAGTDIARFQAWANTWALMSLVALAAVAWRLWGPASAVACAAVYALHDAHLDTMDANYVTWAQLPMILAAGWAIEGLRHERRRARVICFAVAGLVAGVAALIKRPVGVAIPLVLLLALWPSPSGVTSRARWSAALGALGGVVLAHLPVAAHFAAHGELVAFVDGYALSGSALRYASYGFEHFGATALPEGALALAHFLPLPLVLAAFAAWPSRDHQHLRAGGPLLAWLLAAVVAAAVGFRFYKGYFLVVAAPLCVVAAAPWGLLGRARRLPGWARLLLLVPVVVLTARQALVLRAERINRARAHDTGGRRIADYVGARSPRGATVWVWGWHLWDVYPLSELRSGSRIYKSMSIITAPNDDTWRRKQSPLRYAPSPHSEMLLADLERNRPSYIVLGSTVPRRDFYGLQQLLSRSYRRDYRAPRIGRVQFWRLEEGQ